MSRSIVRIEYLYSILHCGSLTAHPLPSDVDLDIGVSIRLVDNGCQCMHHKARKRTTDKTSPLSFNAMQSKRRRDIARRRPDPSAYGMERDKVLLIRLYPSDRIDLRPTSCCRKRAHLSSQVSGLSLHRHLPTIHRRYYRSSSPFIDELCADCRCYPVAEATTATRWWRQTMRTVGRPIERGDL